MTGLCHEGRTAARPDGPCFCLRPPATTPRAILQLMASFLALAARARNGGSYHVRASLCRSGMFIYRQGKVVISWAGSGLVGY